MYLSTFPYKQNVFVTRPFYAEINNLEFSFPSCSVAIPKVKTPVFVSIQTIAKSMIVGFIFFRGYSHYVKY